MKILHFISDTILGGAQRVCIDLANSASRDGNEVAIAAMKGGHLWTELDENVIQFPLEHMIKKINPKNDLKVLKELKQIKKDFNPDIIHLHTSKPGILGRWVFRKEKNQIVYTVHGFDQIRIAHRKFLFIEKFFARFTGAIVPVSKYDEENILTEKIKGNILTIYNGINEKSIFQKSESDLPKKIKESKRVITAARICPPKDLQMFVEVAREFENQDTAFIWLGGSGEKSISEIEKEYNVPSNVYLMGDTPNASSYFSLADIFVLFSNHEGLPMSILEAMCQKMPVVASNVGGIPELVDESNGYLVSNKEAAVKSISELLSSADLMKQKGKASYEKFSASFTLEKMWENYLAVYKSLLQN